MAYDFDGANDNIVYGDLPTLSDATSLSCSVWVWNDAITADMTVVTNFDSTAGNAGYRLYFDDVGSISGRTDVYNVVVDETNGAGGTPVRIESATNSAKANQWQHVFTGAEAGSATGLQIWIDGAEDANSPASLAALADLGNSNAPWTIGENPSAGAADRDGRVAELAFWNRILTDDEILILSKGFSPLFIKKGLIFYAPLVRNTGDVKNGATGTATGAVPIDHPRIIYPKSYFGTFVPGAGAATSIKDLISLGMLAYPR